MSTRSGQPPTAQRAWRNHQRRKRNRRAGVSVAISAVIVALIVVVLFWLTGGTSSPTGATSGGSATSPASPLPVNAPPQKELLAQAPLVPIQLPINAKAVTAVVFRSIPDPSAVELTPTGPMHRYDEGSSGSAEPDLELDVGAPAGTVVYSPVDGQVTGVYYNIVQGQVQGYRLLIAPQGAPDVAVSITHLVAPTGTRPPQVGQAVIAGVTPIGHVIDLSGVETQDMSQYSGDAGNHVAIVVQHVANPA
jgi:hypothetical protein